MNYKRVLFERELAKAIATGAVGNENSDMARSKFEKVLQGFVNFVNEDGHPIYDGLTNTEADKIALTLAQIALFGNNFRHQEEDRFEDIAFKANEIANAAIQESIFTETLENLEAPDATPDDRAVALNQAIRMAVWAAAPNIRFSAPEFQENREQSIDQVRSSLNDALDKSLILDSSEDFVEEVLLSKKPIKVPYLIDDNGDLMYHLYLIQSYLRLNPKLQITLVARKGRRGLDSTFQDVQKTLELNGLEDLKGSSRFKILDDGPNYPGIVLSKIPKSMYEELVNSDVVLSVGQQNFETLNGLKKPIYHMAYVTSAVHQKVTGLEKDKLYFFTN